MAVDVQPRVDGQSRRSDQSLESLIGDLTQETTSLIRQEITLAKTEITQKASRFARDTAFLAIGGAVAYAGLLALVAAFAAGLNAAGLSWWLSCLVVAVIVAAVGGFLGFGRAQV